MDRDAGHALVPAGDRRRLASYGAVLGLLALFVLMGAVARPKLAITASGVLVVALWVAVCRAAGLGRRERRTGLIVGAVVMVLASGALTVGGGAAACVGELAVAAAAAALAVVIARALIAETQVTVSTIAGLLSLYLLIGLFFAQLYQAVHDVDPGAFAHSSGALDRFALIYFSYVSLTTVGFGDITPVTDLTRALAASEAVLGQIFLVTVVAAAVGRVGVLRRRRD